MKYTVTILGRSFEIDLSGDQVIVDGRPVAASLHGVTGTPLRHLVLPDRAETLALVRTAAGWQATRAGETWDVDVVDDRTRQLRDMTRRQASSENERVVVAPMPGLVVRVKAEVGARVRAGAGLLVLEAMKMENELTSPINGVIRAVHVTPGQPVDKGAQLVEVASGG